MWRNPPEFKIRKKAHVYYFLEECLMNNGNYCVKIDYDYCLFIRKDDEGNWTVTVKSGDLRDIFNPELQLDEERAIKMLWLYRKHINEQFFGN